MEKIPDEFIYKDHFLLKSNFFRNLSGSSVHGVLQAIILEWVAIPFSRGSFRPKDQSGVSCTCREIVYSLSHKGSQLYIVVVQLLSHLWLFVTPWTAACQASLPFTISESLLKLMSTKSVTSSNHLIRQRQKTGGNQKLTHIPQFWRRKRQPIPLFLPGKSHGQRSLVGYSLPGWKESDTTKQLSTHTMV